MRNIIPILLAMTLLGTACAIEAATEDKQTVFASPDEAFKSLLQGIEKNDDALLLDVLGHANKDLVVQSDKEESEEGRKRLSKLAKEHFEIEKSGDKATGCFGFKCWPFPIPLAKKAEGWYFDTAAGKEEILNRRIGRNELKAIQFMDVYADAQRDYMSADRTGDKVQKYAQKLISSKDKKDGLYWAVATGTKDEPSPLGSVLAEDQDFRAGDGTDVPLNGYYFRVLNKQGADAPNGKYSFVINGNMIAGFALVGWPADYGSSGIMAFVISHNGTVYQKDLGADTAKLAATMDEYNPDKTWKELKSEDK